MPQLKVAQMSREQLWELLETSTGEVIAANRAYTEWSQLRTAVSKIQKRYGAENPEDVVTLALFRDLVETSTLKCEAIENYCTKKRALHEVIENRLSQLEMNLE